MYRKYKSGYYSNNSIKYNELTHGKCKNLIFTENDEGLKVKLHQTKKIIYNNKKNKYNNFDIDY